MHTDGSPWGPPGDPSDGWRDMQEAFSSSSVEEARTAAEVKAAAAAAKPRLCFLACYLTQSPVIGLFSLSVPKCCFSQQQEQEEEAAALGLVLEDGRLQVLGFRDLNLLLEIQPEGRAVLNAAADKKAQ
ncbi:uncharacterized protein LOC113146739 [Cyclospora cayetanensis]|uniref:Uncharacterized protein LOC113146739 n=1 Tax=Cyclospora cayetanensis TaxID=88456 RepID=A0A6P6RUH7_9EIME|nr:uncharacterized protein LOC113146739 [Cyclospora cayetanensis]